jgi:hypothetical protein
MTRPVSVRTIERGWLTVDADEIVKIEPNWAGPRFGTRTELRTGNFLLVASDQLALLEAAGALPQMPNPSTAL